VILEWFQRRRNAGRQLAVYSAGGRLSLALSDRLPDGSHALRWVEHLGTETPVSRETPPAEATPASVQSPAGERRGQDRRASDRRASDRRQGDRRTGDRRSGPRAPASGGDSRGEGVDPHLAAALAGFVREHELRQVPCVGVLRPGDYSLVLVDSPAVPAAEIRSAMRWQVRELIDFHIDDAVIDVFDAPERDGHAARRLYTVAARRGRVMGLIELLEGAGLDLQAIDIPELALRNLAARLPEDAGGVAIIDLDRQQGLMTVTRQEELYFSRRIDCGSERLLGAGAGGELTTALEGMLDGLSVEIQRSLDYYERHFNQPTVAGIVLGPVPGLATQACEYLQSRLGVPVRWLDAESDCGIDLAPVALADSLAAIGGAFRENRVTL
jgi:MSHA biogenesis protein MshI